MVGYFTLVGTLMISVPAQARRTAISGSKSIRLPMEGTMAASVRASGYTRNPHMESLMANDSVLIHTQMWVKYRPYNRPFGTDSSY